MIGSVIVFLTRYILPFLAGWVVLRCFRSMLSDKYEPEIWGYLLYPDASSAPLTHWESLIGRARTADIVVNSPEVSRIHAVLTRNDKGIWKVFDIGSKQGVFVNRERATILGAEVRHGDRIQIGNSKLTFVEANERDLRYIDERRTAAGTTISPGGLVVPAMSETIARCSPTNMFSSVDFPTFGAPTIATGIPSLSALPERND